MPRTLLTDDVINRLCPEYQPLGNPNAYFDNVGGMVRSEGIKPTPIRAPPRPSRIQYLSSNANIPLDRVMANVLGTQEIAQEVVDDLRVVVRPTAPPIEPNMLAGMPPSFDIGMPPPTFEEALAIGMPPPIYQEILEEKSDIPYVDVVAVQTQGDQGDIDPQIREQSDLPEKFKALRALQEGTEISRLERELKPQMAREVALLERMEEKGIPTPVERAAAEKQSLKEQMARETALLERMKEKGIPTPRERAAAEKQSLKEQMVREVALLERLKEKGIPTPRERAEATAILPPSQMVRQQSDESIRKEARVAKARKQLAVAVSGLEQESRSLFFAGEQKPLSPKSAFLVGEGRTRGLTRKEKNEAVRKGLMRKGPRGSMEITYQGLRGSMAEEA